MNKIFKSCVVLFIMLLIFSACGTPPEANEGELKEVDKKTLFRLIDDEKSQPFLLIATDASEKVFSETAKPIYEDYLDQYNAGTYYINLHDASSEDIEELNDYGSYKNEQGTGAEYDAKGDGMVLVRNGEIEKITTRHVLNHNYLKDSTRDEISDEIKKNVEHTVQEAFD